jgi:SAM-dependent methyltransferase
MKEPLKHLVSRLLRPALVDLHRALGSIDTRLSRIEASESATHTSDAAERRALEDAVRRVEARLDRVKPDPSINAVWRGRLDGRAVDSSGQDAPEMTRKYYDELAYWVDVKRTAAVRDWGKPFDEVYGGWQRERTAELALFLGLGEGDAGWREIERWASSRTAVEIGAGPYPAIATLRWKRAVALDPLADGYVLEGLLPSDCHADELTYISSAGERLPFHSSYADVVVMENCLDHVDRPAAVLDEVRRVLRPDGLVWILVDLMEYKDHMHPNPFNESSLRSLLNARGFDVVRDRVSDHKSHPNAFGEYRGLLRRRG